MDDDHKDKVGALMRSMDWGTEASLILKEWRRNVVSGRVDSSV